MILIHVLSPRATEQMHPQNLMLLVDIITQKQMQKASTNGRKVFLWQRECSMRPKVNSYKAGLNAVAM